MYYGWISTPKDEKEVKKKGERNNILFILSVCIIISTFFYFAFHEGKYKGYTVGTVEYLQEKEKQKGGEDHYLSVDLDGHKEKFKIFGGEYADLKQNNTKYVVIGIYETKFDWGTKYRLGVPNGGFYKTQNYEKLVQDYFDTVEKSKND